MCLEVLWLYLCLLCFMCLLWLDTDAGNVMAWRHFAQFRIDVRAVFNCNRTTRPKTTT